MISRENMQMENHPIPWRGLKDAKITNKLTHKELLLEKAEMETTKHTRHVFAEASPLCLKMMNKKLFTVIQLFAAVQQ